MLKRLRVKNFKLLRDVDIAFEPDVPTVFIGPNSSGKSTIIEVLDFLQRCADVGLDRAVVAHNGMNAIRTLGVVAPVEIVSQWSFPVIATSRWVELEWAISLVPEPGGQVV